MTVFTSCVGTSADAMSDIVDLYVADGAKIADVTYGRGVFWQKIADGRFELLATDLATGTDFRALPYETDSLDALVLDPPYTPAHDGDVKESLSAPYNINESAPRSIPSVCALYAQGIVEAARVLKPKGVLVVKCQDIIEYHARHWTHIDVFNIATATGFTAEDLLVLVQRGKPAMRHTSQEHARANHSYFWVFRRMRRPW